MRRIRTNLEKPEHTQMTCLNCGGVFIFNHPERFENWGKIFFKYYPDAVLLGVVKEISISGNSASPAEDGKFTCMDCRRYMLNKEKI